MARFGRTSLPGCLPSRRSTSITTRRHRGARGRSVLRFIHANATSKAMYGSPQKQSATAVKRLMTEYRQLTARSSGVPTEESMFVAGPLDENNFFVWEALVAGPSETPFEGGVFSAILTFPSDYPLSPPKMTFKPALLHPNVYASGEVCISILHAPGDDPNMYESASERWSPVQSVEKILLSVISMLAEPNIESGANIECCKLYRENKDEYERRVRQFVKQQLEVA